MLQLLLGYFPIFLLIFLMTKSNSMPSYKALPLTALVVYLLVLLVFDHEPYLIHASVIDGLLVAWTPITIIAGAIFLFKTMEVTGALAVIKDALNTVSSNPIAQLMIIGWAFQFLIEGASGFGTPAAIAAPVLVGLGFPPLRVAVFCLTLNSVPVSFGAVGTPTWFGFSLVSLSEIELSHIATVTALINSVAAFPVVFVALAFVVPFKLIKQNALFVLLSILSCVLPYSWIATASYEFPALIGGLTGLLVTICLAKFGFGLTSSDDTSKTLRIDYKALIKATFPLWGTVLILVFTRVPQLNIKPLLQLSEPYFALDLGMLGTFSISAALVLKLEGILNTAETWTHALLYIPSIIPFFIIALMTLFLYRHDGVKKVSIATYQQMKKPIISLSAALVFVNLLMMGGDQSIVTMIGRHLAELSGDQWAFFSPFLGALGSFFSGSATISNLTFGAIQQSIALDLQLDTANILALQSVGAAMGNMVCIANIVAVATILNIADQEGAILKRTAIAMLVYGVVVAAIGAII